MILSVFMRMTIFAMMISFVMMVTVHTMYMTRMSLFMVMMMFVTMIMVMFFDLKTVCSLSKPLSQFLISLPCLRGHLEYRHILVESTNALHEEVFVKIKIRDKVDFIDNNNICFLKCKRIFIRFITALCDR